MTNIELIPHLFRTEFRKIASVLCKVLGREHIEVAEDITSETFLAALETWPYKGIPVNPEAWLYTVAKNKAWNIIRHRNLFDKKVSEEIRSIDSATNYTNIDLSEENITDSQLQMLFAICHPAIPQEAQIGLALRILCGFGIDEIASAFLTNKEVINKRLFRAREKLRTENIKIEFPPTAEIQRRLGTVLTTIYLLFNEGYYSDCNEPVLREELCLEAMRLAYMLTENEHTNTPETNALLSLMCFQSSRFAARWNATGEMLLFSEQDTALWNKELIERGVYYLHVASHGERLSKYHLEASIAYWHTMKEDTPNKWFSVLQLYNQLLDIEYSPIVALNKAYAFSKVHGDERAIDVVKETNLVNNHLYHLLLGELYKSFDRNTSQKYFDSALLYAKTDHDKKTIRKRMIL